MEDEDGEEAPANSSKKRGKSGARGAKKNFKADDLNLQVVKHISPKKRDAIGKEM